MMEVLGDRAPWAPLLAFFAQGVGFPVPLAVAFGILGDLVLAGRLGPVEGFALCLGASWAGNLTGYALARLGEGWVLRVAGRMIPVRQDAGSPSWYARVRRHFWWVLTAARWTGGYPQVLWAAGALRHSPLGVAAGTLLCDAVWAAFWLWAAVEGVAWARRVPVAAA
ncbi:MAG: hypothetical protein AB1503_09475, partial [Bacillota bacterium]